MIDLAVRESSRLPRSRHDRRRLCGQVLALSVTAMVAITASPAAWALPFDPLPSAFQGWLNARRDWPGGDRRTFEGLAQCSDQTTTRPLYRRAVFTCLGGRVTFRASSGRTRRCAIQRVSYYPGDQRVQLWTGRCS